MNIKITLEQQSVMAGLDFFIQQQVKAHLSYLQKRIESIRVNTAQEGGEEYMCELTVVYDRKHEIKSVSQDSSLTLAIDNAIVKLKRDLYRRMKNGQKESLALLC